MHGCSLNTMTILENFGIKNTCYIWEKVTIHAIKATFLYEPEEKT